MDTKTINQGLSGRRFAIINGDDFGFSEGVNRGIIKAHSEGVLTSTSLMVAGDAFEDAVALASSHPNLAVGLHLVVVKGKAVLPPSEIPHLVDSTGKFPSDPVKAGLRYQFNREARKELRLEIRAQLEKFRQTGLQLAHVDGHLHMHSHPFVLQTLVDLADEFEIKTIRLPWEELKISLGLDSEDLVAKTIWWGVFALLRNYGERLLRVKDIQFADRVYGLLQTGNINEEFLLGLIPQITADLVEIYAHPAQAFSGEPRNGPPGAGHVELEAMLSDRVREAFAKSGFELTNYNNLQAMRQQWRSVKRTM